MDNRKDYSKYTVLIVDDIPVNIILLKTMLARTNVKILTAVNGQEALDLVRELKPQVVLLDIQMPVMNGYDAARAIRNLYDDVSLSAEKRKEAKSIPLVAMTANAFNEDVQNALRAGMNAHTAKPLSIENFKKVAQKLLKNRIKKGS